ncbi:MAG: hypothetical protein HOV94_22170 [Saccharothrix sp.]|nr:hypothetical protein [Saccharothrix sp.]
MTVLADYEVVFDGEHHLGDGASANFVSSFSAGGALPNYKGLLVLMVGGLNVAPLLELPKVLLNGTEIGKLAPVYLGWNSDQGLAQQSWYTQHIIFSTNLLKTQQVNENKLTITAAKLSQPPPNAGVYDDFWVRDIVCFFRQAS